MLRYVPFSNFIAAIAGGIASFIFVSQNGLQIFPVLLYLGLLGLPGIFANFVLYGVLPSCRVAALGLHFFALIALSGLLVLAWMLSSASGGIATPFIFLAALFNFVSIVALKKIPRPSK